MLWTRRGSRIRIARGSTERGPRVTGRGSDIRPYVSSSRADLHIVHVTPHLPPDQAANALLPWQLGLWAAEAGRHGRVRGASAAGRPAGDAPGPGDLDPPPRRRPRQHGRCASVRSLAARRIHQALEPAIDRADVVHVHSNGLLAELAVLLSRRRGKPVVLTLYGTEIWHYAPKRFGPDLFTRAYHAASAVTFYSERLLGRARELGLTRRHMQTVYPPVGPQFAWHDEAAQAAARESLGHHEPPPAGEREAPAPSGRTAVPDRGDERGHPHSPGHAAGDLRNRRAPRRAAGGGAIGGRRTSRHVCRARG